MTEFLGYWRPMTYCNAGADRFLTEIHEPTTEQTRAITALVNHEPDANRLRDMLGI